LLLLYSKINSQTCTRPFHIVILGSSTAAGNGATDKTKSWVYLYTQYVQGIDSNYIVNDLAVAGTTTYDAQPNDYVPPLNRPHPLYGHNISAAIALHPDAIIICYASNDAANNYSIKEQENNFRRITERAVNHHILVWVATPQPRNNFNALQVKHQKVMYDWIMEHYGGNAIDFHTGLATEKDSIIEKYSAGDGIHVNNLGHKKIYNRVVKESIPDSLCAVQSFVPITENFMIKSKETLVALIKR